MPHRALKVEAFAARASRVLHDTPLAPNQDHARFGCHVIAGVSAGRDFFEEARPAAVLVPIVARAQGLSLLLTERAAHLKTHAGQVAFPGGRVEAEETAADAALREAQEEVGLDPTLVTPLGFLPPYFSGTGFRVQPMVGIVASEAIFTPDPGEVARVFEVPLSHVLDLARYRTGTIFFRGRERTFYIHDYEDAYIWGVTAGIMRSLAALY